MLFRRKRSLPHRLASCLVVLAMLAQLWANHVSTGHLAHMLSAYWLWGELCSSTPGGGTPIGQALQHTFSDQDTDTADRLTHCPICAVAAVVLAPAAGLPDAPGAPALLLARPLASRHPLPAWPAPAHLRPPAQAPPLG